MAAHYCLELSGSGRYNGLSVAVYVNSESTQFVTNFPSFG